MPSGNFKKFNFLTVGRLTGVNMRHRAVRNFVPHFVAIGEIAGEWDMAISMFWKWQPSTILDLWMHFGTTHEENLVILDSVQNLFQST